MTEHAITRRAYTVSYLALMVLLALTFGLHSLRLGLWSFLIAMTIALVKGLLVLLYFMHLRASKELPWVAVAAGIVWLILLIGGTMSDVLTRYWIMSGQA